MCLMGLCYLPQSCLHSLVLWEEPTPRAPAHLRLSPWTDLPHAAATHATVLSCCSDCPQPAPWHSSTWASGHPCPSLCPTPAALLALWPTCPGQPPRAWLLGNTEWLASLLLEHLAAGCHWQLEAHAICGSNQELLPVPPAPLHPCPPAPARQNSEPRSRRDHAPSKGIGWLLPRPLGHPGCVSSRSPPALCCTPLQQDSLLLCVQF